MGKLLSVIVPVYNAEKYLKQCVDSILGQTYENLELLLINDGSKDGSLALCYSLSEGDSRIRVFNKQNGGAASARNLGLREAKGDYIGFCDADDYFDTNSFETLISIMEENNLPTIECLSRVVNKKGEVIARDNDSREIYIKTAQDAIKDIFLRKGNVSLAVRVTKSEYMKGIQIPEGKRVEDFYFTVLLLLRTGKTAIYKYPFYTCVTSDGSVTRSGGGSIYFDALYFLDESLKLLDNFDITAESQYYRMKMYYLLVTRITREECKEYKEEIIKIKRDIRRKKRAIVHNCFLNKKEKFVLRLASVVFRLPSLVYHLKTGGNL